MSSSSGSLGSWVACLGLAGVIAALLGWWVISGGFSDQMRAGFERPDGSSALMSDREERAYRRDVRRELRRGVRREEAQGSVRERADAAEGRRDRFPPSALAGRIGDAVRWPARVGSVTLLALLGARLWARRGRRLVRLRLVFHRSEEATPGEVRVLLEGLHQLLAEPWWRRPFAGQGGFALEVFSQHEAGVPRVEYAVALPAEPTVIRAFEARLASAYPDARLERLERSTEQECAAIVRLKKRRTFNTPVATFEEGRSYERPPADALVASLAAVPEPVMVQLHLTPAPGILELSGRLASRVEEGRPSTRSTRRPIPGHADRGNREAAHRRLFLFELRVATATVPAAREVAGAVAAHSAGANRLVVWRTRLRRSLYRERMRTALGNPIPSWLRGVISSAEAATLWQAPSPFMKGVPIERSARPRVPAPPQVLRPHSEDALGRDAHGHVGIHREDRPRQVAVLGVPGMGKTAFLCRGIATDARDPNCAIFVLDPKGDLHDAALSAIPEERHTNVVAFARPEMGINPFRSEGGLAAMADGIVEAIKAVHLEGSVQASSERYLHDTALAAGAVEAEPSFHDMYRALLPDEDAYRRHLATHLHADPELISAANFLGKQLPAQLKEAKGAFLQRMDAPLNKLQELLRPKADALFRHPVSLDIDRAIRERRCVVINGACGVQSITEAGLQLVLTMIHHALVRQQLNLPETERVRVCLYADEAHLLFSETFVRMLAMDRSAGLELMAAWQSLNQIAELSLRRQVLDLLSHYVVFQVGKDDARELAPLFQSAHTDTVRDDPDSRRRVRIGPDSLVGMPRYNAAASLIARGARAPGFILETLPLAIEAERIVGHQEAQRERDGAHFHGTPEVSRFREGERTEARETPMGEPLTEEPEASAVPGHAERGPERPASASRKNGGPPRAPRRETSRNGRGGHPPPRSNGPTKGSEAKDADGVDARRAAADPAETSLQKPHDRVNVAPLGSEISGVAVPETYTELEVFEHAAGAPSWDKPKREREREVEVAKRKAAAEEERAGKAVELARQAKSSLAAMPAGERRTTFARKAELLAAEAERIAGEAANLSKAAHEKEARLERWRRRNPTRQELEVIAALGEFRTMYGPQLARETMPGAPLRSVQHRLGQMHERGWLRRYHVNATDGKRGRGRSAFVYILTKEGFELGQRHRLDHGHVIHPARKWREPEITDPARAGMHDLHANAWLHVFSRIAGPTLVERRGPGGAALYPPKVKRLRERWEKPMTLPDVPIGSSQRFEGFQAEEFQPVRPDLRLTVAVTIGGERTFDLLVEIDRSRRASYNAEKLLAYDALLGAWGLELERYKRTGEPPVVVFVCIDEPRARALARAADRLVTGTLVTAGEPASAWPRTGRTRMWFACERDAHMGTLRAYRLPANPPEVRKEHGDPEEPDLEQREFLAAEYLRRHAPLN